jgi:DnaJ-class molecular chaperone
VELNKSDVALQAMICMLCNGVGVLLRRDDTEIQCEQCKGTGLVWLRVVPEDLRVN